MKKNLSAIDIRYLVNELQQLVGARIDKIYHPSAKELLIQTYQTGKGKQLMYINAGIAAYITQNKEAAGEEPDSFCMFLRKHLDAALVRKIDQYDAERIIALELSKKNASYALILEFFAKGNILLTDHLNVILSAAEYGSWKDRSLRPKIPYTYPKRPYRLFTLGEQELKEILSASKKESVVTSLAVDLGLGGVFAEEACIIAGINKETGPKEVAEKNASSLASALASLINKQQIRPQIIRTEGKSIDAIPFPLSVYNGCEAEDTMTFSQALAAHFKALVFQPKKTKQDIALEKIDAIIARQQESIAELKSDAANEARKAELIFEHYAAVSDILRELRKARERLSWKEIAEKLKGHKTIKQAIGKENAVVVELGE